jgi:membrane-bound serine protease (ClpP class)
MSKNIILPIILQLAGAVVIIAEIIIPSGGILAILAIGLVGYSLYIVFDTISAPAGFIFVAADIIMLPVLIIVGIKLLAKSPVTLRKELSSKNGVTSQSHELDEYIGKKGTAITDLRPSGTALISSKRVDVVSRGEYIDKNSKITVSSVTGNQIIVIEISTNDKH